MEKLRPEIVTIAVQCALTPAPPNAAVGVGHVSTSGSAFNGTVPVKVTVTEGQAAMAKSYECKLYLSPQSDGYGGWWPVAGDAHGPKAGTEFVPVVGGNLPTVQRPARAR